MTQEIIIYRNPMEKAIWDTIMSGDAFPFMVGIVVFLGVFLVSINLTEKIWKGFSKHNTRTGVSLALAVVSFVVTIKYLWI